MKATAVALLATLALLTGWALWQGTETFLLGWRISLQQLLRFLPVLILAMLVAGFTETLLPQNVVEHWLSDSAGWRGIGLAYVAGILTPGGSIIGLPIVAALYKTGVGLAVLITYATSFALLSILRIPLEASFYGWRLIGIRVLISLPLPIIAGLLTRLLLPVFER